MRAVDILLTLPLMVGLLVCRITTQGPYGGCANTAGGRLTYASNCLNVQPKINRSIREAYEHSPLFVNFCEETPDALQADNICYTFIPTVGETDKYILYVSKVYRNNTNQIFSFLITQNQLGTYQIARSRKPCYTRTTQEVRGTTGETPLFDLTPGCSWDDTIIGCDPCTTAINYRCYTSPGCSNRWAGPADYPVFGLSRTYQRMTPSCLRQAVGVVQANGVPPQKYVILPMSLSPRCVTKQPYLKYPTYGSSQCFT